MSHSFRERLREHTPDILFVVSLVLFFVVRSDAKKQGYLSDNVKQTVKSVQEIKQANTINFNDSVNNRVR